MCLKNKDIFWRNQAKEFYNFDFNVSLNLLLNILEYCLLTRFSRLSTELNSLLVYKTQCYR